MLKIHDQKHTHWRHLQKMFTEISGKYDLMNRLLTLRFDEYWRRLAARECISGNSLKILDLCTGTGDLALHISDLADETTKIIGFDYSETMLELAREKARNHSAEKICFIKGDVADMPFDDHSIDVIGIAFAFRNLTYKNTDKDQFLKEIYRILSEKGKFVIVETSQPKSIFLKRLIHIYYRIIVSGLGGVLSGHKFAYRYLSWSAINFPDPYQVKSFLIKAGFSKIQYQSLLGGIAGITVAFK